MYVAFIGANKNQALSNSSLLLTVYYFNFDQQDFIGVDKRIPIKCSLEMIDELKTFYQGASFIIQYKKTKSQQLVKKNLVNVVYKEIINNNKAVAPNSDYIFSGNGRKVLYGAFINSTHVFCMQKE